MTDNRLFLGSLLFLAIYVTTAFINPNYHSTFASAVLLTFGAVTLVRYLPEAYRIVVQRRRNPHNAGDGSHLAAYGVALLSAGSVYVGLFGILWVYFGQPQSWLATPVSGFGRYVMAAGFALLFFSPDMEAHRLRLPGRAWFLIVFAIALVVSFYLGMQVAKQEERTSLQVSDCPSTFPVKLSRSGVLHAPDGPYYARTRPKACFASTVRLSSVIRTE